MLDQTRLSSRLRTPSGYDRVNIRIAFRRAKYTGKFCDIKERIDMSENNTHAIVHDYIKGKYKQNIKVYAEQFSKVHKVVDLYELVFGKKLI